MEQAEKPVIKNHLKCELYSLSQLGEVQGNGASGIGHRASGIGHYQLLITYYQFSIVPHLSEKGYRRKKKEGRSQKEQGRGNHNIRYIRYRIRCRTSA
ncbi:MAG: hypothetical protein WBL95_04970 [Microcoleus sp.]